MSINIIMFLMSIKVKRFFFVAYFDYRKITTTAVSNAIWLTIGHMKYDTVVSGTHVSRQEFML